MTREISKEDIGYTRSELRDIQETWEIRFPPDLFDILLKQRNLANFQFDWLRTTPADIESIFNWPLESFWFDVLNNDVWWPEWGSKPDSEPAQRLALESAFELAPKLIPLGGHRYLRMEPSERGNPVFSVYQTDVIYYGSDLTDWISREMNGWGQGPQVSKEIPFWSLAVSYNPLTQ